MSGDFPYSVPGYQFAADTGIGLLHSDTHPIHPSQHLPVTQHLGQVSAQISHSQQAMSQNPMTRLKVEDALSYLDRVKQQFSSTPCVYNDFLDIMKKFKAQSIDTPGVISQVSALFNGHPELMKGFNAFLPVGYKVPTTKPENQPYSLEQKPGAMLPAYEPQHARQSPRVLGESMLEATSMVEQGRLGGMGGSQPVEFNHAINYVNKIKSRYQSKPEVYKTFLDILHVYQNEQKQLKECPGLLSTKTVSETDVFNRVSQLFKDQPDLLSEFSQFLPDAGVGSSFMAGVNFPTSSSSSLGESESALLTLFSSSANRKPSTTTPSSGKPSSVTMKGTNRRRLNSTGSAAAVPARKFKPSNGRDGLPEGYNLQDLASFDKIHRVFGDQDYNIFLRCINLFNMPELQMSYSDLMQVVQPFMSHMPELKKILRDIMKQKEEPQEINLVSNQSKEKSTTDQNSTIDYNACKLVGTSYRTLPRDQLQLRCSGRTELCNQVLNDVYVSCPSWSEDSSSVIKKLGAEEQIFRCEDDRFQYDIVISNFEYVIESLTFINEALTNAAQEEITQRFIDSVFATFSESMLRIAINRLYTSTADAVLDGIKKSPQVVIPIVLSRLKTKADEWRRGKERLSKSWNETNQKFYLKSLDHQGVNFKQTDTKQMRSKALIQELTNIYDQRVAKGLCLSPNMTIDYYRDRSMEDATSLIIHHVKRQTSIHQDEKQRIKQLLKHFIPDLFFLPRGELSDDEMNEEMEIDDGGSLIGRKIDVDALESSEKENCKSFHGSVIHSDESSSNLLFGNHNWYVFIRLYLILCDRLHKFIDHSQYAVEENQRERLKAETSVAISLGYRAPPLVEPEKCYSYLLEMVKSYLDGNLEAAVYEEQLREVFTVHAYVAYTMDKLIQAIVRQLQTLVTESISVQLTELCGVERNFASEPTYRIHAKLNESSYQHRVEQLMPGENYYKIVVSRRPYKVTIDHIPMKNEVTTEEGETNSQSWKQYVEHFTAGDEPVSADCTRHMKEFPFFVKRHLQQNKTEKAISYFENASRGNTDEAASPADVSVCRFYQNSMQLAFATKPHSFLYKSAPRQRTAEQKEINQKRVRQKRARRFAVALSRHQFVPREESWFLSQDHHNTITPFPHASFCSNCCDQQTP